MNFCDAPTSSASQPATIASPCGFFDFSELDEQERRMSQKNAMLVRRVLESIYHLVARSWEARSSSGGSWTFLPPAGEDRIGSSSSSGNYWFQEVPEEGRCAGDTVATLEAPDSGESVPVTPKATKRHNTADSTLRTYLRRQWKHSSVEPAAVTFSCDIGSVELTDSNLLVSPLPPRARSTPPLRGTTWQQGPEADLAAITGRPRPVRVADRRNLHWAPRDGRRGRSGTAPT